LNLLSAVICDFIVGNIFSLVWVKLF
jgi:hypothetical protein